MLTAPPSVALGAGGCFQNLAFSISWLGARLDWGRLGALAPQRGLCAQQLRNAPSMPADLAQTSGWLSASVSRLEWPLWPAVCHSRSS